MLEGVLIILHVIIIIVGIGKEAVARSKDVGRRELGRRQTHLERLAHLKHFAIVVAHLAPHLVAQVGVQAALAHHLRGRAHADAAVVGGQHQGVAAVGQRPEEGLHRRVLEPRKGDAALDRYPAICGEFVWTGFDYLGEPTPFNSDNSVLLNHADRADTTLLAAQRKQLEEIARNRPTSRSSYFGIIDLAGFPKDRYYLYQARWLPEKPMAHILPHWNQQGREGKRTPVWVYTSGDEAELFLNGRSLGRRKKTPFTYRLRWDSVSYEPGELRVRTWRNGQPWAETAVRTTGPGVRLKLTPDKQTVRADGDDLVFVRISVVDTQGREVPDAEPVIRCQLEGAGRIVATDNGDPTCLIAFHETERPAFNGLLLAIVKPERDSRGRLRLSVSAPGLEGAELSLRVRKP